VTSTYLTTLAIFFSATSDSSSSSHNNSSEELDITWIEGSTTDFNGSIVVKDMDGVGEAEAESALEATATGRLCIISLSNLV